jgi:hypothetical protein
MYFLNAFSSVRIFRLFKHNVEKKITLKFFPLYRWRFFFYLFMVQFLVMKKKSMYMLYISPICISHIKGTFIYVQVISRVWSTKRFTLICGSENGVNFIILFIFEKDPCTCIYIVCFLWCTTEVCVKGVETCHSIFIVWEFLMKTLKKCWKSL